MSDNNLSYTTEEIAKILKVSKLTVYDLIKKGALPAYRVGKQMRVDAGDLDAYKRNAKYGTRLAATMTSVSGTDNPVEPYPGTGGNAADYAAILPAAASHVPGLTASATAETDEAIVITGQDIALDILAKHMEKHVPQRRPLRSYTGSMDSLIAMYQGKADIVSTHLLDGDTGQYNVPYIRKLLVGFPYIVVNLVSRSAGIYVQKGNPKKLRTWSDLGKPDLVIANREKGSGARVLLDEQLRLHGMTASRIAGYETEQTNHLAVAGKVASGEVDAGIGIEKAAHIVGVEFIPLTVERYDLVMLKLPRNFAWIEAVMRILASDSFKKEIASIGGYDLSETGTIRFET